MYCMRVLILNVSVCVEAYRRMFLELSSRVGLRTQRGKESEVGVKGGKKRGKGKKACPRNLQMKREGFSLNAIKFFHFTASPADSFSSLGAQSRNARQSSRRDGGEGGGWGVKGGLEADGLAGGKQE